MGLLQFIKKLKGLFHLLFIVEANGARDFEAPKSTSIYNKSNPYNSTEFM